MLYTRNGLTKTGEKAVATKAREHELAKKLAQKRV
jgi:hypothetical protein